MYYLILILPLLSAITAGLFGRFIGEKGAGTVTSTLIVITSIISWISFYEVGLSGSPVYISLWDWFQSGWLKITFGLMFDSVTVVMLILVTTVSALVHIYSTEYMNGDPHLPRFMSYLSLFTFFMLILVTADNFLQLFIGWEGVGLCSYLLINFWFTRIQANKSAMKAMIVNRVGDVGVTLACFTIFITFGSLDFSTVFAVVHKMQNHYIPIILFESTGIHTITLISLLLLIGAIGKSAQLGLHTWLPDAMEGPTPVSALIHAATMVTAGVFLLIRSSPLLEFAPNALSVIVIVGALTALFAATVGLVQNDIKKVIAYSTCSQLGYMIFACGLSNYSVSLFHLMNHGFFKALLFLSAGSVIHALLDEQDMRKFGALIQSIPYSYTMILIGSLSLMGFPFLTGFYSKDAILELAYGHYTFEGSFSHWVGTISAFFTAFYSMRLIYLTFYNYPNSAQKYLRSQFIHESPLKMTIPLAILAFGSIFVGFFFKDTLIGVGTPFFQGALLMLPVNSEVLINSEFIPAYIKLIPVIFSLLGAFLGLVFLHFLKAPQFFLQSFTLVAGIPLGKINTYGINLINHSLYRIYVFLNNKWHVDLIYNKLIVKPLIGFGHNISYKVLDRGYLELWGPRGLVLFVGEFSRKISDLQSGWVYNYAFSIFLFTTVFLLFFTSGNW